MPTFDDDYALRRFRPTLDEDGKPDAVTRGWLEAEMQGFHFAARTDAEATRTIRYQIADGYEMTGVWRTAPTPGSLDVDQPVATFASLPKELSIGTGDAPGTGHSVMTHAITSVTVRATDRRRGMLRRMMTEDLERAAAAGVPLASLTASEGTIYRRFGFGTAIRERIIEVDRARATPFLSGPAGTTITGQVVAVDPATLVDGIAQDVFARFHARTPGSMVRNAEDLLRLLGQEAPDGEADRSVRALVHRPSQAAQPSPTDGGPTAAVDGFVTYRATRKEGGEARIDIVDLVAATDAAYLALWDAVLAIDLIHTVRWETAPVEDPLLAALADNRAYRIVREKEHVWLRVLDVVAALSARPYATDGTLTFDVHDALGIAGGRYRLRVEDGTGEVVRLDDDEAPADLTLDVAELGALYVGGVRAQTLVAAGLVTEGRPGAAALLTAMTTPTRGIHGIAYF